MTFFSRLVWKALPTALLCWLLNAFPSHLGAQEDTPFAPGGETAESSAKWKVFHRYDVRRKVDGQYKGLVYGQSLGIWSLSPLSQGRQRVEARYFLIEESNRDGTMFEKPVNQEKRSVFWRSAEGWMSDFEGDGVPLLRNFPRSPEDSVRIGLVWEGNGEWVVDPRNNGRLTRIPILVQYKVIRETALGEVPAWEVAAKFALRYKKGQDRAGDQELEGAQGTQDAQIFLARSDLRPLYIRSKTEELFQYSGGRSIQNSGFYLTFYEGVLLMDRKKESERLETVLRSQGVPDVKVEEDPQGVRLTLENLLFVADQASLLPGENSRLDRIAQVLRSLPQRSILVVGHTADVGTVESQKQLSIQRAQAIVEALKARGIEARRLLYEGRGGSEPVAPNSEEAGRAKNRRVELTILED